MIKYEIIETVYGRTIKRVNENGTESFIPFDPANSDYQAYLEYIAENPVEDEE
jgi:hypothetical protein